MGEASLMGVEWQAIQDEFISIAQRSGHFDTYQGHEAKNAPGNGIHFEVVYGGKKPAKGGLSSTSVVVTYLLRVACPMTREPLDLIDVDLCKAADAIWDGVHGGYRFDNISGVRCGDLLGSEGDSMTDQSGYITYGQNAMYRVIEIRVPVIINDAYNQAE
jgi:hypothetical protein